MEPFAGTTLLLEDELALFAACLDYVLDHCDDATLERGCGAYRDEVEGVRDDLIQLLEVPESESEEPEIMPTPTVPR